MYGSIEEELDKKIQKASDWNIKLLNTLEQLESQTNNLHVSRENHKPPTILNEESQEKERKIIRNIEERIKIYQKQLAKLEIVKSETYLEKIKELESNIKLASKKSDECSREIKDIQAALNAKQKQEDQFDIKNYTSNIETLKQRLKRLETSVDPTKKIEQSRKKAKSSVKIERGNSSFDVQIHQESKKIDKTAMYRNLIKYYLNQEKRIHEDIDKLRKQRKKDRQEGLKLDEEINVMQKKIQDKRKKK